MAQVEPGNLMVIEPPAVEAIGTTAPEALVVVVEHAAVFAGVSQSEGVLVVEVRVATRPEVWQVAR